LDTPAGFYYGADGNGPYAQGTGVPHTNYAVNGSFGSYGAEVDTWTNWQLCTSGRAVNTTDVSDGNSNAGSGYGIGTYLYWYGAGAGADPNFAAGNTTEAKTWGEDQANAAYSYYEAHGPTIATGVLFLDIEQAGSGYNGWTEWTKDCGTVLQHSGISAAMDNATIAGFFSAAEGDGFVPGVYSSPGEWDPVTGSAALSSSAFEWTSQYNSTPNSETPGPTGFNAQSGYPTGAEWFGAIANDQEALWQWDFNTCDSDNGEPGSCDWDQTDTNNV
jgi:hypothetical protein